MLIGRGLVPPPTAVGPSARKRAKEGARKRMLESDRGRMTRRRARRRRTHSKAKAKKKDTLAGEGEGPGARCPVSLERIPAGSGRTYPGRLGTCPWCVASHSPLRGSRTLSRSRPDSSRREEARSVEAGRPGGFPQRTAHGPDPRRGSWDRIREGATDDPLGRGVRAEWTHSFPSRTRP